jgi:uncharacterized membrane protein
VPTLPLHPAIVHVPLGLAFVIPLVALGLALAWWRRALPRASFGVLVGLQALLVVGGVVAMQLGERDEKRVEPIVGERAIETHEERAEAFVWAGGVVLAGAVAILVVPAGAATVVAAAVAAGTLAVAGLAVAAGEAGGELVYPRGGAAAYGPAAATSGALAVPAAGRPDRGDADDDD